MDTGVFVFGPAGCGKTSNAVKLMKHFKCGRIVDEVGSGRPTVFLDGPSPTLYLGENPNCAPTGCVLVSFEHAMKEMEQ